MAESMFQKNISPVAAPSVIDPGVKNTSLAQAIQGFGGMAVDAWKGYEVARQERNVEDLINQWHTGQQEFKTAAANVQDQTIAIEAQLQDIENPVTVDSFESINVGQRQLAEKQQRLQRAMEQGVLSPDQFNTRLLATVRESINRMPGLERELLAQTERVMKYSGMQGILDASEKEAAAKAKQEKDMEEWFIKQAVGLGISPQDPYRNEKVVLTNRSKEELDFAAKKTAADKAAQEQYFSNPQLFGRLSENYQTNFTAELSKIAYSQELNPQQKQLLIEQTAANLDRQYATMFGMNSNSPQVKASMEGMANLKKSYLEFASGNMTAEALKAQVEGAQHAARLKVGGFEQAAALDLLGKLPPAFYDQYLAENKWASQIVEGIVTSVGGQGFSGMNPVRDRGAVNDLVRTTAKEVSNDPTKVQALEGLYNSFIKTIDEKMQDRTTRAEGITWADNFIKGMVESGTTAAQVNPELRGKMISSVRNYLDSAGKSLVNGGTYSDGTQVRIPDGTEVQVLKDGTILFWNPLAQNDMNKLNKEFGVRMNNAVKALTHLAGSTDYYGTLKTTQAREVLVNLLQASGANVQAPAEPKPITTRPLPKQGKVDVKVLPETQAQRDLEAQKILRQEGLMEYEQSSLAEVERELEMIRKEMRKVSPEQRFILKQEEQKALGAIEAKKALTTVPYGTEKGSGKIRPRQE